MSTPNPSESNFGTSGRPIEPYTPTPITSFKRSQIAQMSPKQYAENRAAILEASKAGLVEDDLTDVSKLGGGRNGTFRVYENTNDNPHSH